MREYLHDNSETDRGSRRSARTYAAAYADTRDRRMLFELQRRVGNRAAARLARQGPGMSPPAGLHHSSSSPVQTKRYEDARPGKRVSKPPFDTAVQKIGVIEGPHYEPHSEPFAGGVHSWAVLGPDALVGMGTDANPRLPPGIDTVRRTYPQATFYAGHLLNADFGGSGQDPRNLTILTSAANTSHKAFDNPVKRAVEELRRVYEYMYDDGIDIAGELQASGGTLGIRVDVETDGASWGSSGPDRWVSNGLVCTARVTGSVDGPFSSDRANEEFESRLAALKSLCIVATSKGKISNPKPT